LIKIDLKSNKPIYEQIIQQIKEGIIKGIFKSGDLLPSVRKLAVMLEVNPNTVSKAYQEMERQGIIVTVRGKGTFIDEIKNDSINEVKILEIVNKLKPLILELKYMGLKEDEIINLIKKINSSLEK